MQQVRILGSMVGEYPHILTPDVQKFLAVMHQRFDGTRRELLRKRHERQAAIDAGRTLDFLPETAHIRSDPTWSGPVLAPGLVDRRVEITGPVDRKMVINALNSGATQFMADFEDSNSPTWANCMDGQINLRDANRRTISLTAPNGKFYSLRTDGRLATLVVRPRGWHLDEKHFLVGGEPISASIFDFGVYFFHNARKTLESGAGPYFYLPKMESHLEARLWNDVFNLAQDYAGIPRGTIRATVLIETLPAAFEMDEIIFELREHSAGLNCGRWDYIFSAIKRMRNKPDCVLPDRAQVTMSVPFMDAYVRLLIQTCHKRRVHAMGGMAAQIPIKDDKAANDAAMEKVRQDKLREVHAGHDGTWVAHPGLIPIAMSVFNEHMPQPNQLFKRNEHVRVGSADLLNMEVRGEITEAGIAGNIAVGLQYMEAWLRGNGCVPINNLMEDAATAEISRSQLWQWVRHGARTASGRRVTREYLRTVLDDQVRGIREQLGPAKYGESKFGEASNILWHVVSAEEFVDFITLACYDKIVHLNNSKL